jgi:hypothetical protein
VGADDEPVPAAALGVLVVVAGRQIGDRGGQLGGEGGPFGGRPEADLGVEAEGGQPLAGPPGPAHGVAHLAHHPGGQGQQVLGRQPVGGGHGVAGGVAQGGGGHEVGAGGGGEQALGQAPPAALLDEADEAVGLEGSQVVVDLLAREVEGGGQGRGRARFGQGGQEPGPGGVEGGHGGGRIGDDLDGGGLGDVGSGHGRH